MCLLAFFSATSGGYLYYSSLSKSAFIEAETQAASHAEKIKNLVSSYLTNTLKAVKALSGLKALQQALLSSDEIVLAEANYILDHFQDSLEASVVYLMDQKGQTIASSNRDDPNSFVGKNYSFRPYFQQAAHGSPAVYMALGVTSNKRGVYYSHPVYGNSPSRPIGVVVVKASVETIEQEFFDPVIHAPGMITFITGPHGVVFMSDHKELLYQVLWKIADEDLIETAKSKQFGTGPWEWAGFESKGKDHVVDKSGDEYLLFRKKIESLPGWSVVHLSNLDVISKSISDPIIRTIGYTILALCVLIGLSVLVLYNLAKADIVKRLQAEAALRESEEKYRSMMEAMTDAAYICSHDFRVEYMNPAMIKRIGHDATGEACHQAINALEEKCPWCVHYKVQKGEHAVTEIVSPKDNRTYSVSNSPIHHLDGTISKLTIHRDLTELKKMEEELLKARKLESIGLLAGGMAHDFNNLLSIIMGNISMLQDDLKPEDQIAQFLNDAQEASRRARELTRQLITFSKGGAPVKQAGSIKDLLKEITSFIPADSNVKCEFLIPPDLNPVEFDKGQMQHAFKNLIINAAESMPESGLIKVRAENLILKSESKEKSLALAAGEYVKISIQDHGVGICSENLALIFDPYFSTKEMGTQKGMGMGLATTYSIIKKHSGHIIVESEVDVGTTVAIYLPAYVKKVQKIEPIETQKLTKTAIRTRKILLMDDEKSIRHLAEQMLSRLDYDAETAKDGEEAIELFKRAMDSDKPIDVVILDLTIKGGMGGKDVIKILQKINPQVKAIVSSGYSNDPVMTDFEKYGFAGALPKPYAKKDLKDMLQNILSEKRSIFLLKQL